MPELQIHIACFYFYCYSLRGHLAGLWIKEDPMQAILQNVYSTRWLVANINISKYRINWNIYNYNNLTSNRLNFMSCADHPESYFLEHRGLKTCSNGSMIMDKTECATACHELGTTPTNNLRNGKPCYRAGNGKCRQNGAHGSGASLICKNTGDQLGNSW